jgi:hypothetical protein
MVLVVRQSKSRPGIVVMYSNRAESVFVLAVILAVITFIVLLVRFWSRTLLPATERRFLNDDWTVAAAWVSQMSSNTKSNCLCPSQPSR